MRHFQYSMALEGPAFKVKAKTVFEAREKITKLKGREPYMVWEDKYAGLQLRGMHKRRSSDLP